jgi:hypothetical protein
VRSIAALVAAAVALIQRSFSAHHGTETRVLLSAIRAQATRAKHTSSDTHTHTHTQGNPKKSCRREQIFNPKKKGPPLSFPTGNNLLNGFFFLPNGKKLCIYIPPPLPQSSPPRPSARTSPLTRVCVCVYTAAQLFYFFGRNSRLAHFSFGGQHNWKCKLLFFLLQIKSAKSPWTLTGHGNFFLSPTHTQRRTNEE